MTNFRAANSCSLPGLAAASSALSRPAFAQAYPARPVRLVVPFNAGGSTDLIGRIMCQWLTERLGQSFVVENRPGGGTNIATQLVVNSPPDGYTLLYTVSTHTINPSLYKSLPFDFQRDIVAGRRPRRAAAGAGRSIRSVPAKNVAEFIAYAKANPGKVNIGLVRRAHHQPSVDRAAKTSTGIEFVHVPYTGGAPMVTDIISGRVQAGVDALPNSLPHIRSGSMRALADAVAGADARAARRADHGEIIPGFEATTWNGVGAPQRHAARDRRAAQPRDQRGPAGRSPAQALRRCRRRADPRDARRDGRDDRQGHREVGQGGEGRRPASRSDRVSRACGPPRPGRSDGTA